MAPPQCSNIEIYYFGVVLRERLHEWAVRTQHPDLIAHILYKRGQLTKFTKEEINSSTNDLQKMYWILDLVLKEEMFEKFRESLSETANENLLAELDAEAKARVLASRFKSSKTRKSALAAMANLDGYAALNGLGNSNIIPDVVEHMSREPDPAMRATYAKVISRLSYDSDNIGRLHLCGAVTVVLRAMRHEREQRTLLELMTAINHMLIDDEAQETCFKLGGIGLLAAVLKNAENGFDVRKFAAATIMNRFMVADRSDSVDKALESLGGISLFFGLLKTEDDRHLTEVLSYFKQMLDEGETASQDSKENEMLLELLIGVFKNQALSYRPKCMAAAVMKLLWIWNCNLVNTKCAENELDKVGKGIKESMPEDAENWERIAIEAIINVCRKDDDEDD